MKHFILLFFLSLSLSASCQTFYDGNDNRIGRARGGTVNAMTKADIEWTELADTYFYDSNGHTLAHIDGKYLYDSTGGILVRYANHQFFDRFDKLLAVVQGNLIYNGVQHKIGRIDGNRAYDGEGNTIGRSEGVNTLTMIVFYFFCIKQ